jgi:hypothetical protein
MEYEHILTLCQGFEPLFRSSDLDPHQGEKPNPDPRQIKIRIQIRILTRFMVIKK